MILHILTKAPDSNAATQMQQAVGDRDAVMLIEAAVIAALDPSWTAWQQCHARIFLLSEDLIARGLASIAEINGLPTLEMNGFVALTEQYEKAVTWY
ncbi:sulfurtransferase complex subunit TusB [Halomonas sp. ISL-60]|uniref:sulfurtransferase complex subunit TusB n=1 Tax=Halomonas sp. ISL-56 TaxID=2819149 RepID=UPI001BEC9FCB|nr:sulfurtransferase complex subunit TusB [Halomonas sp. ISL-56]MBT2774083.1 sulfurtransferase complex subunit TusB [Halomonas sp. ISL-60]MBT2802310.1 sulfurtransferase complex subunit TusB [Halomonas sp. ISL-56]